MFKSSSTDESYDSRNQLHKQMSLYSLNARNKKSSNLILNIQICNYQ
jgi:hypothetical protein